VEEILEGPDVGLGEASAEVAGGGRVGDAAGAQGVEEDLVVAPQFDVLEAGPLAECVIGEVEDVVGLVEGEMDLEQVESIVDGVDQADLPGQVVTAGPAVDLSAGTVPRPVDAGSCVSPGHAR
jgi:uncharacterized protein YuzB (UPF0349 family)